MSGSPGLVKSMARMTCRYAALPRLFVAIPAPFTAVIPEFSTVLVVNVWIDVVCFALLRSLAALGRNLIRTGAAAFIFPWTLSLLVMHELFPLTPLEIVAAPAVSVCRRADGDAP
jgi:hypothetical protein